MISGGIGCIDSVDDSQKWLLFAWHPVSNVGAMQDCPIGAIMWLAANE
jgi:hypothetical protein